MAFLILPHRWRQQPSYQVELDQSNSFTNGLIFSAYNSAPDVLRGPYNYVTKQAGTTTAVTAKGTPSPLGLHATFDGSTSSASHAIDLSPYVRLSFSFLLWWDSYANNDSLAFEYTPNFGSAVGGMIIDPNSSRAAFEVSMSNVSVGFNVMTFPRPSAGAWHAYTILTDRGVTNTQVRGVYVDGALQTLTNAQDNISSSSSTWANSSLYFMSRNASSLRGAGKLACVNIHSRLLSAGEAQDFSEASYNYLRPIQRRVYFNVPAAGGAVTGTLSATLGALTSSATGTLPIVGTASQTLGALTSSATGTLPIVGTLSQTLGAATLSSAGTSGSFGAVSATLGAATLSSTGTLPIVGTLSQTLGAITVASAGTLPIVGTLSQTLGAVTLSATNTAAASVWTNVSASATTWTNQSAASSTWTNL